MLMLLEAFFPIPPPPRRQPAYPIPSWIPGTSVPAIFWITYTWYHYTPGGGGYDTDNNKIDDENFGYLYTSDASAAYLVKATIVRC